MNLINLTTMTPISESEFRAANPHVSFPAVLQASDLTGFNVAPLNFTPCPTSDYSSFTQGTPTQNADGSYSTTWIQSDLPLEQAQEVLLNKVAAYRRGIAYQNITYNNISIPVDTDVMTILNVVASGTQTINFKGSNGWLSMAPSDAKALIAQIQTQVQNAFTNEKNHHDAIMALTTVAQVQSYDFSTGW
jgi:hypothetical protein